ncbi:hypothetical protein P3L51_29220 [Streptomyces sp. PSRA5]|uniref:hypothetical protein n=1 Tax=Streptomyces panacea TaxID=3035064 RepID=UPI00339CC208
MARSDAVRLAVARDAGSSSIAFPAAPRFPGAREAAEAWGSPRRGARALVETPVRRAESAPHTEPNPVSLDERSGRGLPPVV